MKKYLLLTALFFMNTSPILAMPKIQNQDISQFKLPPLEYLEEAALNYAGIHPHQYAELNKRARWSAALPRLQVGFDRDNQDNSTSIIEDNVSVTSGGVTIGPESNRIDNYFNNKSAFEVKAVWYLNELIFNQDALLISREARDSYLVRQKIVMELHQAYYELKQLLLELNLNPQSLNKISQLQIEQLVAKLNSLSGNALTRWWENN